MFVTKRHISRRDVLRGVGATIALPFLEAMVPARTLMAKTAAAARTRLSCIEMVHGSAGATQLGLTVRCPLECSFHACARDCRDRD